MPSQLGGSTAVAIQVYQALYGRAPSNPLLNAYTAQASANPQSTAAASASAFANDLASGFSTTTDANLALQVLNNINITAATVTAPGSTPRCCLPSRRLSPVSALRHAARSS